jgi:RNA polymerase sigma-70 factor (ECF subfamily)
MSLPRIVFLDPERTGRGMLDFDDVYRREWAPIVAMVTTILQDRGAAEDIVSEAFASLSAVPDPTQIANVAGWLRTAAFRRALNEKRNRFRRQVVSNRVAAQESTRRSGEIDSDLTDPELTSALKALSPHQRGAVLLHYVYDLPLKEISEHLNCSVSATKVHLSRGRAHLRNQLTFGNNTTWRANETR